MSKVAVFNFTVSDDKNKFINEDDMYSLIIDIAEMVEEMGLIVGGGCRIEDSEEHEKGN